MAMRPEQQVREEVRQLIEKINRAWREGRPAELCSCFHDNMVIQGPGLQVLARGKEQCVKSYEDFLQQAKVSHCQLEQPDIHVWGTIAVATYAWEMTYELNGQEHHESGHDVFALSCEDGPWQAVWRAMRPSNGA